MLGLFGSVRPYLKPKRKVDVPRPDNLIFKLHYKVSKSDESPTILRNSGMYIFRHCIMQIYFCCSPEIRHS